VSDQVSHPYKNRQNYGSVYLNLHILDKKMEGTRHCPKLCQTFLDFSLL
jgi:hypothetical protein